MAAADIGFSQKPVTANLSNLKSTDDSFWNQPLDSFLLHSILIFNLVRDIFIFKYI